MSQPSERSTPPPSPTPVKRSRFHRLRGGKETPLTLQFQRAGQESSQTKYFLVSDTTPMNSIANPKAVLSAVGITVIATLIAFFTASSLVFTHYRVENHLPSQVIHGVFGDYTGPASVGYSMLDGWLKIVLAIVAVGYPVLHALVGRGVFALLHGLCVMGDEVFLQNNARLVSRWTAESKMLAGALWPVTMLVIPFLAIAVMLGGLYRRLWTEPLRHG